MNKTILAIADRVLVEMDPKEAVSAGGIYIPEQAQDRPTWGTVKSVGPKTSHLKVGDRAYVPVHSGTALVVGGKVCVMIREDRVLAREEV